MSPSSVLLVMNILVLLPVPSFQATYILLVLFTVPISEGAEFVIELLRFIVFLDCFHDH
jgi:hypothetical protein